MARLTSRQRHTRSFERRQDGTLLRVAQPRDETGSSSDSDGDEPTRGLFARPTAIAREDEFIVERIWSKKSVNRMFFYLIQWEGHAELTWEPRDHIPWQLIAEFERENHGAIWYHYSTRGRPRRNVPREEPTRTSRRLRGKVFQHYKAHRSC